MYCPKCGCEIDYKTKYCRKCGAKLPYNMEFDKNSDSKSNKFNLSTRNQIMILSILGLVVIIILSSFAFSGIFFNSPSNVQGSSSSFDDFINNNLASSAGEDVEYTYYPSYTYGSSSQKQNDTEIYDMFSNFFKDNSSTQNNSI